MRYTLRLLTLQQFERAALLICSCEAIRRRRADLGDDPISLGLWVGQGGTPNTLDQARKAWKGWARVSTWGRATRSNSTDAHGVEPTRRTRNYYIAKSDPRLVILCHNKACEFESGLPVFLVDEDLYRHHPTLIIATVDKFASLPWNDRTRALFNLDLPDDGTARADHPGRAAPHLRSAGDPGRPVRDRRRPALHRRRDPPQGHRLDGHDPTRRPPGPRAVRPGGPPVPAARARLAGLVLRRGGPPLEKGTRLYVGLMAPGTSQTTLLVRTYAALLQGAPGPSGLP